MDRRPKSASRPAEQCRSSKSGRNGRLSQAAVVFVAGRHPAPHAHRRRDKRQSRDRSGRSSGLSQVLRAQPRRSTGNRYSH